MKKIQAELFFYNKRVICCMIITLMFLEYTISRCISHHTLCPYSHEHLNYITIVIFSIFTANTIAGCCFKCYKISSLTLKKILSNALGFGWLSLLFIAAFGQQYSWFIDASYKIFIDAEFSMTNPDELLKITMIITSIFILILLFPKFEIKKDVILNSHRKTLFSAISIDAKNFVISARNIQLFIKPFCENIKLNNSENEKSKLGIEKVILLYSEGIVKSKIDINICSDISKMYNHFSETKMSKIDLLIKKHNELVSDYDDEKDKSLFITSLAKILESFIHLCDGYETVIVKIAAEMIDFNNFDACFEPLSKIITFYEKSTTETVIYTSPGTSILSGALTSLAIKGDRLLLYADQNYPPVLRKVDVNIFTMEELLSELWGEQETYGK